MDALRRLPLFVLPTVLFPGALLPLHVFEPRYRQMAARCLETDKRFGVLYHDGERWGPFALREGGIGCVAEIVRFQPLPDGRSLLLTQGLERFRIVDEHGGIRPHVRLWVGTRLAKDLGEPVGPADDVTIVAALSGG